MALLPYPRRFHGGTSGWTFPAASVARARSVCRPTPLASHTKDQSCHWEGSLGGSTVASCQSPAPVRLISTRVIGAGSRPRLAADGVGARVDGRAWRRVGDAGANPHVGDGLRCAVRPLVHVVAGLELADEGLGDDVDSLEPLDGGHGVPVRHDEAHGCPVIGTQRLAVHEVGDEDSRLGIGGLRQREGPDEPQVAARLRQHGREVSFIARADGKLTTFLELETAVCIHLLSEQY